MRKRRTPPGATGGVLGSNAKPTADGPYGNPPRRNCTRPRCPIARLGCGDGTPLSVRWAAWTLLRAGFSVGRSDVAEMVRAAREREAAP